MKGLAALALLVALAAPAEAQRRTCREGLALWACRIVGAPTSTVGEVLRPGYDGQRGIERWRRTIYGEKRAPRYPRRDNWGFRGDR